MLNWFAFYWVFAGLFGAGLAYRLGMLAAQDRGTLLASNINGSYALIARKMIREASLRFLTGMFAVFVGLIVFLRPSPPGKMTAVGMSVSIAFSMVKTLHVLASYYDLTDRARLVKREGVLRDAPPAGPTSPL